MVARVIDLKILAQTDDARRQLDVIAARAEAIGKLDPTIKVRVDKTAVTQGLAVLAAETKALAKDVNVKVSADGLVTTTAQVKAAQSALKLLGGTGYGVWGILGRSVSLFGGIATLGALHLLIDATAEFLAVVIPASAALLAFGVGAAPVVGDIYNRMLGVFNVSRALNETIYPMSGEFVKLATAVQPEVYQLFGQALVVMNAKTGEFTQLAVGAGHALDQLGARAAAGLVSGGLSAFLKDAVPDLAKIGDVVGNIFGIIGNLLRSMPGYAQVLLNVLDGVTKGLEAVTASPVTQWLVTAGLAFHGAYVWIGLAATASVLLGNALLGLGARLGLVSSEAVAFNAKAFIGGILQMGAAVGDTAVALVTMAGAEDVAAASTGILDGAMAALDAVNPLVWVIAGVAALAGLVYWLTRSTSATAAYDSAVKNALQNAPVTQLGVDLTFDQAAATGLLKTAQDKLNATQEYSNTLSSGGKVAVVAVTGAYRDQSAIVSGYKGELASLAAYQSNYNVLLKAAGGNLGLLAQAGITTNDVIGASKSQLAQYVIEIQAVIDSTRALALGTGRSAAALSAETSLYQTETIPALQKLTQAEDNVLSVITAAPQAFLAFQDAITGASAKLQTPAGLAGAASVAGAKIGGLNAQSQALANAYYGYAIPAAQKVIDALQQQSISTGNLTTAVATEVKQMLPFTKGNDEARSVLVDLINNALGPGTVSLQTLNKWVGSNSTTLAGFNAIVAKSTIAAGTLAGVLQNQLNIQFHNDLLAASGASGALKIYTADLVHNQQTTDQGKSDRARLIADLENAGLSAKQATAYVNGLSGALTRIPKTEVSVIKVTGQGSWTVVSPGGQLPGGTAGGPFPQKAAGGMIYGAGGPTQDNIPIMASAGEYVVKAAAVNRYGPKMFDRLNAMAYASGGVVGSYGGNVPGLGTWAGAEYGATVHAIQASVASATAAGIQAAIKAAIPTGPAGGSATPGLMTVARYMMSLGASAAAAAGIAGTVAGESGGDPEAVQGGGGGGMGLIQWTPGSTARPYQPIITGNAGRDMAVQLVDMAYYISGRGGLGRINAAAAAGGPMSAAWVFSGMEAPAVPGSDIRPTVVAAIYAALTGKSGAVGNAVPYDTGGLLPPGLSLAMNTTGRAEVVAPGGVADLIDAVQDVGAAVDNLAGLLDAGNRIAAAAPAATGGALGAALNGAARSAGYRALYPG